MLTLLTSGPLRQLVVLAAISVACGGDNNAHAASSAAANTGVVAGERTTPVAFTAVDLIGLEKGLAREADAVLAARARGRAAKTPAERGLAAQGEWEDATIPEGARAAGMPVERYRKVRATVHETLETLDFQGRIDGPLEIDLSAADPAMKARLSGDAFARLAPASSAALKARMTTVVAAWVRYTTLVAVNG